ncbi:hypothetical protein DFH06DRAFT_1338061 [Mycena polygramma]|nr:hypothetical protein DFH06DRAFT_1338061 [Mycena polygramma]
MLAAQLGFSHLFSTLRKMHGAGRVPRALYLVHQESSNDSKDISTFHCLLSYPRRGLISVPPLEHPLFRNFPARLKIQGFDGPATIQVDGREPSYDTPGEDSVFSTAFVGETLMELVGTWRYDVLHTATFQGRFNFEEERMEPSIVDLLTVALLSAELNHTREGYPETFFLAFKNLFNGVIASHRKAPSLPADISRLKSGVIDAF